MTSRGICQRVGVSLRNDEHFPFWTKMVRTKIKPVLRTVSIWDFPVKYGSAALQPQCPAFHPKSLLNYTLHCWNHKDHTELFCDCRSDFEHEARILTSLKDSNLVRVLGVCYSGGGEGESSSSLVSMVCEYTDQGDLYQFLQDHVAETSLSKSPGTVPTLR